MQSENASDADPAEGLDAHRETAELFLVFRLAGGTFGVPVARVHEILDPIPRTAVPNASAFAPALVNVRGAVVPLLDLAERLSVEAGEDSATSRLVVLDLIMGNAPVRLAISADSVERVLEVGRDDVQPLPPLGAHWPEEYVAGVVRSEGELLVLLDTDAIFACDSDLQMRKGEPACA